MALARKPQQAKEKDVDALILKGGSVSRPEEQTGTAYVQLRIPRSLLAEVDDHMSARRLAQSRHAWIVEAIIQRLDRESQ